MRAAVDLAVAGPGAAALSHILNIASTVTAAPNGLIVMRDGKRHRILAVKGFARLRAGMELPFRAGQDLAYRGPAVVHNAASLAVFEREGPVPPWQWMATMPIPVATHPNIFSLICFDMREGVSRPPDLLANLGLLAPGIAHIIELLNLLGEETARGRIPAKASAAATSDGPLFDFAASPGVASPSPQSFLIAGQEDAVPRDADGDAIVIAFLRETLIASVRYLQRGGMGYHALRRWRSAVKPWQMLAITQLKQARSAAFADMVAAEMADAADKLFGRGSAHVVAAVPCGHSGSNCMAEMIARRVATALDLEFVEAFEQLAVTGSSHPRRNARRPAMRARTAVTAPVLLIDDIATSGSHIAEAKRHLREASPAVFPLVWLAAN